MNRIKRTETAVYHCMTRAVAGEFLLDEAARNVLRKMLWKVAGFCGVEVLAYCLMDNHFHVLVRVPEKVEGGLSREEVLRRYRILYENSQLPEYPSGAVMQQILLGGEDEVLAEEWMQRLTVRMQDVSEFMRMLKHRLTVWYNKKHERFGTLWAERFKSVLVENRAEVLRTVAAYVDLNPVRAGLVEDPATYGWCSYGEAMAGKTAAQAGLCVVMGCCEWKAAVERYRVVLFGKGGVVKRSGQAAIPAERVREVLANGGKLEPWELLRCRVRYFTAGGILGSKEFVRAVGASLGAPGEGKQVDQAKEKEGSGTPMSSNVGKPPRMRQKALAKLPLVGTFDLTSWRFLRKRPLSAPEVRGDVPSNA